MIIFYLKKLLFLVWLMVKFKIKIDKFYKRGTQEDKESWGSGG